MDESRTMRASTTHEAFKKLRHERGSAMKCNRCRACHRASHDIGTCERSFTLVGVVVRYLGSAYEEVKLSPETWVRNCFYAQPDQDLNALFLKHLKANITYTGDHTLIETLQPLPCHDSTFSKHHVQWSSLSISWHPRLLSHHVNHLNVLHCGAFDNSF